MPAYLSYGAKIVIENDDTNMVMALNTENASVVFEPMGDNHLPGSHQFFQIHTLIGGLFSSATNHTSELPRIGQTLRYRMPFRLRCVGADGKPLYLGKGPFASGLLTSNGRRNITRTDLFQFINMEDPDDDSEIELVPVGHDLKGGTAQPGSDVWFRIAKTCTLVLNWPEELEDKMIDSRSVVVDGKPKQIPKLARPITDGFAPSEKSASVVADHELWKQLKHNNQTSLIDATVNTFVEMGDVGFQPVHGQYRANTVQFTIHGLSIREMNDEGTFIEVFQPQNYSDEIVVGIARLGDRGYVDLANDVTFKGQAKDGEFALPNWTFELNPGEHAILFTYESDSGGSRSHDHFETITFRHTGTAFKMHARQGAINADTLREAAGHSGSDIIVPVSPREAFKGKDGHDHRGLYAYRISYQMMSFVQT